MSLIYAACCVYVSQFVSVLYLQVERYHSVWRIRMQNAYIRRIWRGGVGEARPALRDTDMVVHNCVVHIDPSDLVNTDAAQGRLRLPAVATKPKSADGSGVRKRKHAEDDRQAGNTETYAAVEYPVDSTMNEDEDDEEEDDDEDILAQYYRSMEEI
jgi:hypothetical protein